MNKNIPIIYYHSVAPSHYKRWNRYWLTLELKYFEAHLKYFKQHNYESLFLNELFQLKNKTTDSEKYFLLTFDDGYVDNYIYAYPLLKKYGFKGTIFINPDFIDEKHSKRKTLFDYWNNRVSLNELDVWGFLNWEEMREMEQSGFVDIQSHTMSHTKYFISDKLIGFHHPGADSLYQISNLHPAKKPYYITDQEFEKLIPYGYPIFEQASSVIAKKVTINDSFIHSIIQSFKLINWDKNYSYVNLFNIVKPVYDEYKKNNSIIVNKETEEEYRNRVYKEIKKSKDIIEKELKKKVNFLCWPHGDNNEFTHSAALGVGYIATTLGKMQAEFSDDTRFVRFGLGNTGDSILLTNLKTRYKVESYRGIQPFLSIKKVYEYFRDRVN